MGEKRDRAAWAHGGTGYAIPPRDMRREAHTTRHTAAAASVGRRPTTDSGRRTEDQARTPPGHHDRPPRRSERLRVPRHDDAVVIGARDARGGLARGATDSPFSNAHPCASPVRFAPWAPLGPTERVREGAPIPWSRSRCERAMRHVESRPSRGETTSGAQRSATEPVRGRADTRREGQVYSSRKPVSRPPLATSALRGVAATRHSRTPYHWGAVEHPRLSQRTDETATASGRSDTG